MEMGRRPFRERTWEVGREGAGLVVGMEVKFGQYEDLIGNRKWRKLVGEFLPEYCPRGRAEGITPVVAKNAGN